MEKETLESRVKRLENSMDALIDIIEQMNYDIREIEKLLKR